VQRVRLSPHASLSTKRQPSPIGVAHRRPAGSIHPPPPPPALSLITFQPPSLSSPPLAAMALRHGVRTALRAARAPPARGLRFAGSTSHEWMPARFSQDVRAASRVVAVDEPPTAPLTESHDFGEGVCDFSNYVDAHEDTGLASAAAGLATFAAVLGGVYAAGQAHGAKTPDLFTRREFPFLEKDFPLGLPNRK